MKSFRERMKDAPYLPAVKCPGCGKKLDAATHADDPGLKPSPGDYSICLYCGALHVFDETLRLRPPSIKELLKIAGNTEILDLQRRRKRGRL
jgi:hypothetical protein